MRRTNSNPAVIWLIFLSLTFISTYSLHGQTILVNSGADWKYLDDGSDQGTSWRSPSFDDAGWSTGSAQLGYGDSDEATVISYGSDSNNKYITYYFRHSFTVTDPSQYPGLTLGLVRDDGAIVYLNGIEIERSNMPGGTINYLTLASAAVGEGNEDAYFNSLEDPDNLVSGTNVLAVEIHQISTTSSDISFDLQLQIPNIMRKAPYLIYNGNNTEMQVLWQLSSSAICTIEWGTDTQYLLGSVQTNEYGDDHQHAYTITNLTPATKYYYSVTVNQDICTGSFYSAPNLNASSIKFFVYGDTRTNPGDHDQVALDIVDTYQGDENFQTFILSAGDLISSGSSESDWDDEFFSPLYPNIQEMLATLPYQSCMGNHELPGVLFTKYLPYPFEAARYWSFDYGIAHFVVIDQYTSYGPGSTQLTWIASDLASRPNSWNFLIFHEPGWSAGSHDNDTIVQDYIQPLCLQYNVHAVFAGHNHYYARAIVDDVHHITSGGGGAPLSTPNPGYPNIVTLEEAHHFCIVEIDGTQLSITAVDTTGNIIDSFTTEDMSLPVELSHFAAYQEDNCIIVEWTTESEVENSGFILERKESHNSQWQEIASYITCPELQGQGSIPYRTKYRYEDKTAIIGKTYDYRLADVSYNGEKQFHSKIIKEITLSKSISLIYNLYQNYPNPFNSETIINYTLEIKSNVKLSIYDILGREIEILINQQQSAGEHSITFDASNLTSGIYFCKIKAGSNEQSLKMILMR